MNCDAWAADHSAERQRRRRSYIRHQTAIVTLAMLWVSSFANAHPGHGGQGFASGAEHPITGLDHVLAMVGVGLLAVGLKHRWIWMLPAIFVSSMIIGAAFGAAGLFVPSWLAETGIAASVFAFGLLITLGVPLPALGIAAITSIFAIFHGSAHAAEMSPGSSVAAFFVGFTLSTILLHAIGIGIGLLLGQKAPRFVLRGCGVAMSVCGALMLVGVL